MIVSGSTGFIGRHLCRHLQRKGVDVVRVGRNALRDAAVDDRVVAYDELFSHPDAYRDVSAVVHLGARVHQMSVRKEDERLFHDDNCVLTEKLAHFSVGQGIKRFVFASSVKVMGATLGGVVADESIPPHPGDMYGKSKAEAEDILKKIFSGCVAHCCILRFPMIYGPWNKGNMLRLLSCAYRKIPLPIGGASKKRSMVYVENVCSAIDTVICGVAHPDVVTFYLTDGMDVSSSELYRMIFRMMHDRKGVYYVPPWIIAGISRIGGKFVNSIYQRLFEEYRFSADAFCTYYKWHQPFSLEYGVANTVQWYIKEHMK